jgi:hypothetical protein
MGCYTSGCGTADVASWRSVRGRVGDERTRVARRHREKARNVFLAQVLRASILLIFYFLWQTTQNVSVVRQHAGAHTDVSICRRSVLSQTFTCHYSRRHSSKNAFDHAPPRERSISRRKWNKDRQHKWNGANCCFNNNAKRSERQNDVVRAMAGTVELAGPAARCWHRDSDETRSFVFFLCTRRARVIITSVLLLLRIFL